MAGSIAPPEDPAAGAVHRPLEHYNRAFWVSVAAAFVALVAALIAPASAFGAAWQIGIHVPHSYLATALCAVFPLLGLAGVLAWGGSRLWRQLLVWAGGLGTCAVATACVLLAGPHHTGFVTVPDGASPGGMAFTAVVAAAAALTMMVADAISWRRACGPTARG